MKALPWIKKILFPFYKTDHQFLMEKWWFRLSLVLYAIIFVWFLFFCIDESYKANIGWCWETLGLYEDVSNYNSALKGCMSLYDDFGLVLGMWSYGIITPIVIHYIFQLVFFKIIINFIVLGGRKTS